MTQTAISHNARQNIGHYEFHPKTNTATISGDAATLDCLKSLAEALGWKVVIKNPKDK